MTIVSTRRIISQASEAELRRADLTLTLSTTPIFFMLATWPVSRSSPRSQSELRLEGAEEEEEEEEEEESDACCFFQWSK